MSIFCETVSPGGKKRVNGGGNEPGWAPLMEEGGTSTTSAVRGPQTFRSLNFSMREKKFSLIAAFIAQHADG